MVLMDIQIFIPRSIFVITLKILEVVRQCCELAYNKFAGFGTHINECFYAPSDIVLQNIKCEMGQFLVISNLTLKQSL